MTDADLVRQTLGGQVSAFETLVRRWSARVQAYLRAKVHHLQVAEDLTQEAFLRAFQSLDQLSQGEKFGPWTLSIAHRLAIDWLKAKARSEVTLTEPASDSCSAHAAGDAPPWEICQQNEQHAQLRGHVDELPPPLREVLIIYYYDKVTYQQMADMLGVSTATINARLTKARALLRDKMSAVRRST